jgi:acyl carrier protein
MDKMEIQDKVVDILMKHSDAERSSFTPEKNLKLDLGLDSLDVAEIVFELEETFSISINEQSAEKILKISDTVDFISDALTTASAAVDLPMAER